MTKLGQAASFTLLVLGAAACAESATAPRTPAMQAVVGVYGATGGFGALSFTTTTSGQAVDWLAAGAAVSLRLNSDGTTAGHLFIPGADEDGADMDADLAGTWTMDGGVVTLDHEADTFLRDMPLTVDTDRLEGDHTFDPGAVSETRVQLVLQRQ